MKDISYQSASSIRRKRERDGLLDSVDDVQYQRSRPTKLGKALDLGGKILSSVSAYSKDYKKRHKNDGLLG